MIEAMEKAKEEKKKLIEAILFYDDKKIYKIVDLGKKTLRQLEAIASKIGIPYSYYDKTWKP